MSPSLLLASLAALAPPPTSEIVVLPASVEGDITEQSRQALTTSLREGLNRAEIVVVDTAAAEPCATTQCAVDAAKAAGATFALLPRFSAVGRDYEIRVTLVDARSPETTVDVAERCELCGLAEVSNVVGDVAIALADRIAQRAQPGRLEIASTPDGALVVHGDTKFGVTPFEIELAPRSYELHFVLDGYIERSREVIAVAGATTRVEVELQPVPVATATRAAVGLHVAGGVLDGLGVAAVGAGVALLVLDDRAYQPSCLEPRDPITGACRQRYNTLAGGAASVAGGVVSLAIGIGLHILAARRGRGASRKS